jgi:hypothetical protein
MLAARPTVAGINHASAKGMSSDKTVFYFGTALRIDGVNSFYARRVLQRCERGEITLLDAAKLMMSVGRRADATTEIVGVRRWEPEIFN